MKSALVIGGSNGIGLSIVHNLNNFDNIYIVDKVPPDIQTKNIIFEQFDLVNCDYSIFDRYSAIDSIDTLIITAGIGRIGLFENIKEEEILNYFTINTISVIRIIKHFYHRLLSKDDFYCGVMVSIAGFISSPLFSVYGASKAALKIFIESVNIELEKSDTMNRILNISPGAIKGTKFNDGINDIEATRFLAQSILDNLFKKNDLFIPMYDEIFKNVLERYHRNFREEGKRSYEYKVSSGRFPK